MNSKAMAGYDLVFNLPILAVRILLASAKTVASETTVASKRISIQTTYKLRSRLLQLGTRLGLGKLYFGDRLVGVTTVYYEWDAAKARRKYLLEFVGVWLAAIAVGIVPLWYLVQETTF